MRRIINGKIYDTETAQRCFGTDNGDDGAGIYSDSFDYYEEIIFRTKKGNWFLYGSGNYSSKYRESQIIPLLLAEALEWLSEHDCHKTINKYFSDQIEEA
jgi:hypothetical protein